MRTFIQDLRYGARMLLKRPIFSLIAVITLALGIGANLTIFSFVDTMFLRPLPAREPYQLVTAGVGLDGGFAYPAYTHFRDHNKSFEGLAAHYSTAPLSLAAPDGDSERCDSACARRSGSARLRDDRQRQDCGVFAADSASAHG